MEVRAARQGRATVSPLYEGRCSHPQLKAQVGSIRRYATNRRDVVQHGSSSMRLVSCARSDSKAAQLQQEGDLVTFEAIVLVVKRSYLSVVVDVEHADALDDIGAGARSTRVSNTAAYVFGLHGRRVSRNSCA